MSKTSEQNQQAAERAFMQQQQKMFKVNLEYLKSIGNLNEAIATLSERGDEHLQFLGVVSYFIGLDFMTTTYKNREIMERVSKRVEECIFGEHKEVDRSLFLHYYFDAINAINPKEFEEDYQNYIKSVEEELPASKNMAVQSILIHFKKLLSNSTVDVASAYDLDKLLNKGNRLTYQDILKINSTITEHLTYLGRRAVDEFAAIYGNEVFNKLLKEAVVRYDRLRYGTLFNESVVSMRECIERGSYGSQEDMIRLILGGGTDEEFEQAEKEHQEKLKEEENKKKEESNNELEAKRQKMQTIDINQITETDPLHAFLIIVDESLENKVLKTSEDFMEGIQNIATTDDYVGDVYRFISANMSKVNDKCTTGDYNINIEEIRPLLETKVTELRATYKKHAEDICRELPKEQQMQVNRLINDLISNVIMSTMEQKEYLPSQLYNPGVKTYQHLTQIMNLIEKGNMKASPESLMSYRKLYDYIKENISEQLDEIEKNEPVFNQLSFYGNVQKMLDAFWNATHPQEKEAEPASDTEEEQSK